MLNIRLPPVISLKPTIIVLSTNRNFQILPGEVDTVSFIDIDCRLIHPRQSFDRRIQHRTGIFQIGKCLQAQNIKRKIIDQTAAAGILLIIEKDPSSFDDAFLIDQNVNQRRSVWVYLFGIEWPLVAL